MKLKFFLTLATLVAVVTLKGSDASLSPDVVIFKDGHTERGLIVKNGSSEVVIRVNNRNEIFPKASILRINDAGDDLVSGSPFQPGSLPAWRVIENDLRTSDSVQSLDQVSSPAIATEPFRNIPYLAFRMNGCVDLQIFGNPEHPVGMKIGISRDHAGDQEIRESIRGFLAGFLDSPSEISALYSLSINGGQARAGAFTVQVSTSGGSDGWSICAWNTREIAAARSTGSLYAKRLASYRNMLAPGFYRDNSGMFHLLAQGHLTASDF